MPRDPEHAVNVLLHPNIHLTSSIIEDKPPDYKALFPQNAAYEMAALNNHSNTDTNIGGQVTRQSIDRTTSLESSGATDTPAADSNNLPPMPTTPSSTVVVVVPNERSDGSREGGGGGEDATSQHKLTAV